MSHKLFTWLFVIFGTIILLFLGQWQLDRLVWKQSILEEIESKVGKNKDGIAEAEKKATVNEKTIQLFKLEIEELKLKAKNPLAN